MQLLSEEHFTVDGTLIQAWAGRKQFRAQGSAAVARHGSAGSQAAARSGGVHDR